MAANNLQNKEQPLFTVGELAKRIGVTPRTIQYYDKEGLLKPREKSESGHRLYSDEELVKLYQIVSLKDLGFSLSEIKLQLTELDTPQGVANMLRAQTASVDEKIKELKNQKRILIALEEEVQKRDDVDFTRYADIITSLQIDNDFYWAITYMDKDLLELMRSKRTYTKEDAREPILQMSKIRTAALRMLDSGVRPDSPEGMKLAKSWWNVTLEVVDGDLELLHKMSEITDRFIEDNPEKGSLFIRSMDFIAPALEAYFVSGTADQQEIEQAQEFTALFDATHN